MGLFKKDKEEFSRGDPQKHYNVFSLTSLSWIIPCIIVVIGAFITTQKFAPMMNYDTSVIGNPLIVFHNRYRLYNPAIFILGMAKFCFNDVYSYYFFQAIPPVAIAIALAILLWFILNTLLTARQKNQHIHGTARWATEKDLKKFGMLCKNGVVCGELSSASVGYHVDAKKAALTLDLQKQFFNFGKPFGFFKPHIAPLVCHSGRTNTWMIAPTRSGKGVSTVIPTCISYGVPHYEKDKKTGKKIIEGRGSMVIFDPKGENWDATAGWRSQFSDCILFRPLDEKGNTAHYNPIHEIPDNDSEAFSWADMIGEIFFGKQDGKSGGGGDASEYFNNTARDIFAGVVMHVRFAREDIIPWKEKNLSTVLDMFSQVEDEGEGEKQEGEEDKGPGMKMLSQMREKRAHVHDDGSEAKIIHSLIVKAANRSETQNPKERASTYSTVFSKISLFQDPLLRNSTAYSDFSVDDFVEGKNGISLYLIVPYNHIKRISPIFRMVITFMIKKFSSGTTNANSVKLKIPCLFLLDEFPVLGYFPDIALNAGILAGYGVTFFIVSQSLNQIVDVYGENHPFLDHCKTLIIYAPGNFKDAKQFSETIGNRSVLLDNISTSGNKKESGTSGFSRSSQETSTSLINPDELMKLEFNRNIVINQGMPPYKGKKVVYYEDPRFKTKAFLPVPSMKKIYKRMSFFPSAKKKEAQLKANAKKTIDPNIAKAIQKSKENKEKKELEDKINKGVEIPIPPPFNDLFSGPITFDGNENPSEDDVLKELESKGGVA